ncbi:hypothetical protein BN59_01408 [Legionella massiliensis]|uniref:Uncharacterized protein n=1 Tax=Legionella massiliensis TaxID=1034943 RepID=A0A078KVV2_9GAMM|nr:hypothetical protein [Legionella massiliensis]CDZ77126.1 hypothetical protein BN59_01408 [Legionella massiliensis]CEE12864.1 hypothetical protein BN1094_01408 [Legionella massiliensis]
MRKYLEKQRWIQFATTLLLLLPILSLALNAISWLRYGIDIPVADEWGDYINGTLNSFNPRILFNTVNDTMSPLYRIFNALSYYYLDANSIAYQLISMIVVLGAFLFLQWKLLSLVLPNQLIRASTFSLSLLILQPDTYWGGTNGAFIQAVPLIFNLAILYIVMREPWRASLNYSIIFISGLLSGFSYISGAFGSLTQSLLFILISRFMNKNDGKFMLNAGLVLLIPAVVSVLAQLWILLGVQHGVHSGTAFSTPIEKNFWLYILGKVARSLMFTPEHLRPAFAMALIATLLSLVASYLSIKFIIKNAKAEALKTGVIYLSLFSIIAVYLFLVAAGRVYLYPAGKIITNRDMFAYGFPRFHYFWITLLWPWVITVFFYRFKEKVKPFLITNCVAVFLIIYAGALNHPQYYEDNAVQRSNGLKCLIGHGSVDSELLCPDLHFVDLRKGLINAVILNAAFTRSLPFQLSPIPLEQTSPLALFRLEPSNFSSMVVSNATGLISADKTYQFKAANDDPHLVINMGDFAQTRKCRILDVAASIKVAQTSTAQLFYITQDQSQFKEQFSLATEVKASNQFETIHFTITNHKGFSNLLRLDPTNNMQDFELKDLVVRCRLNDKAFFYE